MINHQNWQDERLHSSHPLDVVTQKPQVSGENFNETIIKVLGQILLRSKGADLAIVGVTAGMHSHISVDKHPATGKQTIIELQN